MRRTDRTGSTRPRDSALVGLYPSLFRVLTVLTLAAVVGGCAASRPKPRPAEPPVVLIDKPVIDFSRGAAGLPLEQVSDLRRPADLVGALTAGFAKRLHLPPGPSAVAAMGAWPDLDLLRVDLSNGTVREDYKPRQFKTPAAATPVLTARRLEYIASPLYYDNGPTNWSISADDARLGLIHDEKGHKALVLTDCSAGAFEFSLRRADLEPMLLAGAREHSRGGFAVRGVQLSLTSPDPRSLWADMTVRASWLLLPATFRIRGQLEIDDAFNVHLSGLSCEGQDVTGALIAGFIDRAMSKYNNKALPVARWPDNRITLTGVSVQVDDSVTIRATFRGRPPALAGR
jgi:hypothetical protein